MQMLSLLKMTLNEQSAAFQDEKPGLTFEMPAVFLSLHIVLVSQILQRNQQTTKFTCSNTFQCSMICQILTLLAPHNFGHQDYLDATLSSSPISHHHWQSMQPPLLPPPSFQSLWAEFWLVLHKACHHH